MTVYLLDTNYLVYLADDDSDEEKRKAVLSDMAEKLQQNGSRFVLTPLIRYEVLRGVDWGKSEKLSRLTGVLAQFESLDITQNVSDLASDLYRFDKFEAERDKTPKNLEKRKFDMFHYATASVNNLEILSHDTDVNKIKDLYERMRREDSAELA